MEKPDVAQRQLNLFSEIDDCVDVSNAQAALAVSQSNVISLMDAQEKNRRALEAKATEKILSLLQM